MIPFLFVPTFRAFDSAGNPLAGGLLYTYAANTLTPQTTWSDAAGTQPNANPVVLDSTGSATVRLSSAAYKFVLKDSLGTTQWTQDFYQASYLAQADIAALLYPQTAAETAASVTPVNLQYPELYIDRYGTNTTPGTTSMRAAYQAMVNVLKKAGGKGILGKGPYLLDAAIDYTYTSGSPNIPGFTIEGPGGTTDAGVAVLIVNHTADCFDYTGAYRITMRDVSIRQTGSSPRTCFLLARNSSGASAGTHRFENVHVVGSFQYLRYNYGSESCVDVACEYFNTSTAANSKVFVWTANNIAGLTSAFTTIATLNQSCIDHQIEGGQYAHTGGQATTDVFELESASEVKINNIWISCGGPSSGGRSLFFIDTTNGPSNFLKIDSITMEASAHVPSYAFFLNNNAATCSGWKINGATFYPATHVLNSGALVNFNALSISACVNNGSGGINIAGNVAVSTIDFAGTITIGGTFSGNIRGQVGNVTITGANTGSILDTGTGALKSFGQVYADGSLQTRGQLFLGTPAGTTQIGSIYGGSGVPSNANGNNGDYYFRTDTPGTANQRLYVRSAGAWVGIV